MPSMSLVVGAAAPKPSEAGGVVAGAGVVVAGVVGAGVAVCCARATELLTVVAANSQKKTDFCMANMRFYE
jgi:hypothetical protein